MKIDNKRVMDAIASKDYDTLLKLCDTIIYYHLHKSGFWVRYATYRDDFMQEGRLAILNAVKIWRSNGKAQFTTFAHIVVRNHLYSFARKMKWLNGETNDYELTDDDVSIDEMKALTLYYSLVDEMERDRNAKVLKWYFIEQHNQDTIGKKIGKSQQWVNSVCNEFKTRMRERYKEMEENL